MARHKGFTAAALVSFALGIGVNTALFSVVYGVLLRPLPYPDAGRLVRLWEVHPGANAPLRSPLLSNLTFHAWRESARTLDGLAAYRGTRFVETSGPEAVRFSGAAVSPSLFALIGTRPAAGRLLQPEDAIDGAEPVAVLSHGLWNDRYGADASVIGRRLTLDGDAHTIVGIAPAGFYFPDREARLWTAFVVPGGSAEQVNQSMAVFSAIGRLRPGFAAAQAAAEGTAVARGIPRPPLAETLFGKGRQVEVRVQGLLDEMTARVRAALLALAAAVGLVLLICCANIANLLLSRGVARQRELAVRAAIGASYGRLVRQLVTEGLLLALSGGLLAVLLGAALVRLFPLLAPAGFPRLADVRWDAWALAFATFASLMAGLLSALLPALRSARTHLLPALHDGVGASAPSTLRLGGGLLAAEAALAVVLLVGAGLLARSFGALLQVDAGYAAHDVVLARVYIPAAEEAPQRTSAYVEALLDGLRATPGVEAAGAGNMAPFAPNTMLGHFPLPDPAPGGESITARVVTYVVTPGYAEALSLRLREGRLLRPSDAGPGIRSMLVNDEFARAYLSDGRPVLGRRFPRLFDGDTVPSEIVGIVGNVLKDGLDTQPQSAVYLLPRDPYLLPSEVNVAVRTTADPESLAPILRAVAQRLEPHAAVEVALLAGRVSASVAQPRFAAVAATAFALLALGLAATGLYGVLTYNVLRRRREMGVRSALGATRSQIVRLVLRQGLAPAIAGLFVGMAGAAALTRFIRGLLFGVTPLDPFAFAAAPALLLGVALIACLPPAWRAATGDPVEVLRCE